MFGRWYGPYALQRISRRAEVRLRGRRLLTDPEVLHPIHFLSTRVLVDAVRGLNLSGQRFLDMGSGSGAIAVFAAAQGARVTACDINPSAVALTQENLKRNQLGAEVLASDLFSALSDRVFDLICFNIPYYDGEPRTPFDAALFGGKDLVTVRRFADGCRRALAPGGQVIILFSEDANGEMILSHFRHAGLEVVDDRISSRFFERFHVVRFRALTPPVAA
jgi:release factor glutamine methyltransferase